MKFQVHGCPLFLLYDHGMSNSLFIFCAAELVFPPFTIPMEPLVATLRHDDDAVSEIRTPPTLHTQLHLGY